MLDIDTLLAETATDPPCGPDLEYSAEFIELERLAQGKPEQQFGSKVIPAEAPPWPLVLKQAAALLTRSKDLRIAMLYARAATVTHGVSGLVDALRLIDGMVSRYWDALYPPLETGDVDEDVGRAGDGGGGGGGGSGVGGAGGGGGGGGGDGGGGGGGGSGAGGGGGDGGGGGGGGSGGGSGAGGGGDGGGGGGSGAGNGNGDDDGDAAQARLTALAALADPYTPDSLADPTMLVHELRAAPVARSKGATLSVRDMLIALGRLAPAQGERGVSLEQMQAMLRDARAQRADALDPLLALPGALDALSRTLTLRLGAKRAPALTLLTGIAHSVAHACREAIGDAAATDAAGVMDARDPGDAHADSGAQAAASSALEDVLADAYANPHAHAEASPLVISTAAASNGHPVMNPHAVPQRATLSTREDAIALLDAVQRFIERTEPTNPAPLLIRRAKSLMGKDFVQIIQELAPDSLAQIRVIAGTLPDDG